MAYNAVISAFIRITVQHFRNLIRDCHMRIIAKLMKNQIWVLSAEGKI